MTHIHWLGHEACHETRIVGGKAASLSRLAAIHAVPPGFAIPALDAHDGLELPRETTTSIRNAYGELVRKTGRTDVSVAVRSSAIDEDHADTSFAGQHDTYLNITGADAVIDAVGRCRASARSEVALAYRKQQGLSFDDVKIGVLVQELVVSDVSAVVFSHNPLNGSPDEIVINASWGLGESLVGGTVTPDTYVVRKSKRTIASCQVANKERMTVIVPEGTREVAVPKLLSEQPCLTDDRALEMAELAIKLETATGHPVDIECAIAEGALYLLQCRPITTLGQVTGGLVDGGSVQAGP